MTVLLDFWVWKQQIAHVSRYLLCQVLFYDFFITTYDLSYDGHLNRWLRCTAKIQVQSTTAHVPRYLLCQVLIYDLFYVHHLNRWLHCTAEIQYFRSRNIQTQHQPQLGALWKVACKTAKVSLSKTSSHHFTMILGVSKQFVTETV